MATVIVYWKVWSLRSSNSKKNMPLIINSDDVKWYETKERISIIIPLFPRVDVKTSILTTSRYLKVSSSPWLWECFLAAAVDPATSIARIGNDNVSFDLRKKIPELWNDLLDKRADCKDYRRKEREKAYEENQAELHQTAEMKSKKQKELHQASVRKQMHLEDQERKLIEKEKRMENERVASAIEQMKKEQARINRIIQEKKEAMQKLQKMPPPRKSGHITVSFTPRVFPTAARESMEAEENEWLEKQAEASKCLELDCKDLSPAERNPEWLKAKAESMFKKGDYRSAVNAYSLAIRMCPNLYSLYSGRAACHLNLRNLHKCIEDSSRALELLVPPVPSNAPERVNAHRIRGTAFHQLELPAEGLMDFEEALKIDPNDEDLKRNAEILRHLIETGE